MYHQFYRYLSSPLGIVTLLLMISTGVHDLCLANDSSFGGVAADLTPLKRTDIVMQAEDIQAIESNIKGMGNAWRIHATYTFHNPTDQTISFTMGFPEQLCDPDIDCAGLSNDRTTFRNIITSINGVAVNTQIKKVGQTSQWANELGRVHLFPITFKAHETVTVTHQYLMGISSSVEGEKRFHYITKTGALWGGPIGIARFSISVRTRPIGFYYPKEYRLKNFETEINENNSHFATVEFIQKNWVPTADLDLTFTYEMTKVFNCPPLMIIDADPLAQIVEQYLKNPISIESKKIKTRAEMIAIEFVKDTQKLSVNQLKICRNIPFARYGYSFKNKILRNQLYKYSKPTMIRDLRKDYQTYTIHDTDTVTSSTLGVLFRPSVHYHQKLISASEWKYIKALRVIERFKLSDSTIK